MKSVTLKYGVDTITKSNVDDCITIEQLVKDENTQAVLGYGDNVRVLISGVEQSMGAIPPSGCILSIETRCNTKATA